MATDIEASIKEIHAYAQKYFDLLRKHDQRSYQEDDDTEKPEPLWKAEVGMWFGFESKEYHGSVLPSYMMFGNEFGHLMDKGYHADSLEELLGKMLKGTKEEYETFRDTGMVPGIG
jgi:hypothetical protein